MCVNFGVRKSLLLFGESFQSKLLREGSRGLSHGCRSGILSQRAPKHFSDSHKKMRQQCDAIGSIKKG